MKKYAALIIAGSFLAVSGIWYYFYRTGEDFALYEEAKSLEASGDIYGAHDAISKALEINPTNRKVISYKAELYFLVKNDKAIKTALSYREEALRAMNRGDYVTAAGKLDAALASVDNVSTLYKDYAAAVEIQEELLKDVDRLVREAPEKYYSKALDLYKRGEYERAYETADYVVKPDARIRRLKSDIAYKIGSDKFALAEKGELKESSAIKDAVIWLEKVDADSPDSLDAKRKINLLKKMLP